MTPRLTKEFRALLMPWSLAVLAALLGPLCRLFQRTDSMHGVAGGVATFANFALCAGLGLLAAFSFGAEFQQRTLPLLLAQPVERFRLWREKLVAVVVALATVGLLHAFGWGAACLLRPASAPFEAIRPEEVGSLNSLLLVAMIVLATICSTNFWTLWARSTIGGLVFNVMGQFLAASCSALILHTIFGDSFEFEGPQAAVTIVVVGLLYSGVFLFLGWRKFAHLELRDPVLAEGLISDDPRSGKRRWSNWLVCRSMGSGANLWRKEVRLQKPVLLCAMVFVGCCMVALVLETIWSGPGFQKLITVLTCFYVPLALILAGCVSLGEEKTLGLAGWQLTLPVSAKRLWFTKLATASLSGLAFGYLVPCLIFALQAGQAPLNLNSGGPSGLDWPVLAAMAWAGIVLSFWASTLVGNAVRAALITIIVLAVWIGCVMVGIWCAQLASDPAGGLQTILFTMLMAHYQRSPIELVNLAGPTAEALIWVGAAFLVLSLARQSSTRFRHEQQSWTRLALSLAVLSAFIGAYTFWVGDLVTSAQSLYWSRPVIEMQNAFTALASRGEPWTDGKARPVTIGQLEAIAPISAPTKAWLRNAIVTYQPGLGKDGKPLILRSSGGKGLWGYMGTLQFPNGGSYAIGFSVPVGSKP